MDKNQVIGIVLISIMLFVYLFINQDNESSTLNDLVQKENAATEQKIDSIYNSIPEKRAIDTSKAALKATHGTFANAAIGTEEEIILENEDLKVTFTSKGGKIKNVVLKKYTDYQEQPLLLLDEQSSQMQLMVEDKDLYSYFFEPTVNGKQVSFSLTLDNGTKINQHYSLPEKGYLIDYTIDAPSDIALKNATLRWNDKLRLLEKGRDESVNKSAINYYLASSSFDDLGAGAAKEDKGEINEGLKWVAMKQRFFNASIIAKDFNFDKANLAMKGTDGNAPYLKNLNADIIVSSKALSGGKMQFYFGPNELETLEKTKIEGFDKNIDLGWTLFAFFNKYVIIKLFKLIENVFSNYGIVILILVIIIKLALFPIAYRSYLSMAKMRELKPEIDKIKESVGDDMQKQQQETMKLYRKVGVNPMSGCIPVLLQMPILLALFNFFPNNIALRHQPFLWADDLSSYDSILDFGFPIPFYGDHVSLFTLLMTISTIVYTYINNKGNAQAQGPMKSIGYIMPLIFMFVLNKFSSGLTYYYFVSNLITISQQLLATRFIDKDKIRETLEANKQAYEKDGGKGGRKKSKFQQRLDEAMKLQEERKKKK